MSDELMKRVSLEIARFKPFDGEAYDGLASRLITMVRADTRSKQTEPVGDTLEKLREALEAFKYHARLPANVNRSKRVTVPAFVYHQAVAALASLKMESR